MGLESGGRGALHICPRNPVFNRSCCNAAAVASLCYKRALMPMTSPVNLLNTTPKYLALIFPHQCNYFMNSIALPFRNCNVLPKKLTSFIFSQNKVAWAKYLLTNANRSWQTELRNVDICILHVLFAHYLKCTYRKTFIGSFRLPRIVSLNDYLCVLQRSTS